MHATWASDRQLVVIVHGLSEGRRMSKLGPEVGRLGMASVLGAKMVLTMCSTAQEIDERTCRAVLHLQPMKCQSKTGPGL